jgi:nucleoid-associated protein YgaU
VTDVLPMDAPARRVIGGEPARATRGGQADRPSGGIETPPRPAPSIGQPAGAGSRGAAERPTVLSSGSGTTDAPAPILTPTRADNVTDESASGPSLTGARAEMGAPAERHGLPVIGAEPPAETVVVAAQRTPVIAPPPRPSIGADVSQGPVRTPPRGGAGQPRRHVIAERDSLWALAMQYYDDGSLWPKIKAANPGLDEAKLIIGREIMIPSRDEVAAPPARATERPAPPPSGRPEARPHTYVIEQGDTLIGIARNILGNGNRWREIWDLNKEAIPNPDVLPIGAELKLPPRGGSGPEHG